jgi:hypothetical protein
MKMTMIARCAAVMTFAMRAWAKTMVAMVITNDGRGNYFDID